MSAWQDKVKGNWNIIKGKMRQQWADLTDDDLEYAEGKEEEMLGRVQRKTGKTKDEITSWIDSL